MGVNVSFRDVDEDAFREFKVVIARLGLKAGVAVSEAFRMFSASLEHKKKKKVSFLSLKPVDWGSGTEKSSSEIDEVLYGWKK